MKYTPTATHHRLSAVLFKLKTAQTWKVPLAAGLFLLAGAGGCSTKTNDIFIEIPKPDSAPPAPSRLSYGVPAGVYTVGVPIEKNPPTSTGGAVTSYAVVPHLPPGLSLDASTGVISGTPSARAPQTNYVVTASNPGGSGQCQIVITVVTNDTPAVITVQSTTLTAGASGLTASVPAQPGSTYTWGLTNGTILAGGSTSQIAFAVGTPGPAQLTCTASNAAGIPSAPGTAALTIVAPPVIAAFGATATNLTEGNGTTLSYSFEGGLGTLSPGNIQLSAGTGTLPVTPSVSTTYTLTVSNAANTSVQAEASITLAPAPAITSFTALPARVFAGGSAMVTGLFTGGAGSVDPTVGALTNGVAASTGPITAETPFTLTVSNGVGGVVTAQTSVNLKALSLFAGCPNGGGALNGTGANARFNSPRGVAVDSAGNAYVADLWNQCIRKISPAGVVTTLAGTPGDSGNTDGQGSAARFNQPCSVAMDAAGNLYVADSGNNTIRLITPGGLVTTLAGSAAGNSGSADGQGTAASFQQPTGVAVDTSGNVYVADSNNHTIRAITPGGLVSTLAGTAGTYGNSDGPASAALFGCPASVAVDKLGNLYVADSDNANIRMITSAGVVSTLAGSTRYLTGSSDGLGTSALFYWPNGVAVDSSLNVYVADTANSTIRMITPAGQVSTMAGTAQMQGSADDLGAQASFRFPYGIAVGPTGNVLVADSENQTIREISPAGAVSTLAGLASNTGSTDATGATASFHNPAGVAVDGSGNTYVADSNNNTIRKITPGAEVSTLAGTAGSTGNTDGLAGAASFNQPEGAAVDGAGNVYVADTHNNSIRKITPAGMVSTLATGFNGPFAVAADGPGNIYVTDSNNHAIDMITAAGVVSILAGTAGSPGDADGPGASASFNTPQGVAVDGSGNLYVADSGNRTIRKLTPTTVSNVTTWTVTTLAGTAGTIGSADGTGGAASFGWPQLMTVDGTGNLFVTDPGNSTIRMITPAGVVTTVVGVAGMPGTLIGPLPALVAWPAGVAVDPTNGALVLSLRDAILRVW